MSDKVDNNSKRLAKENVDRYSQLVDAAVVELHLCADHHLTRFLRIELKLNPRPV